MQLTTRQHINKLHEQLITHVPLNGVRIFGYDHYPAVYELPASTSLADMLWAVLDAAQAAGDFSPVLELLKYHHRTAYENFMAWLEKTGPAAAPAESPSPPRPPGQPLSFSEKQRLIDALLACDAVSNPSRRQTLHNSLPAEIKHTVPVTAIAYDDTLNFVTRALNYPDGLDQLLDRVRRMERGTTPMHQVDLLRLAVAIYDRAAKMADSLGKQLYRQSTLAELPAVQDNHKLWWRLVTQLAGLPHHQREAPLLKFGRLLIDHLTPGPAAELQQWLTKTAEFLGLDWPALQSQIEADITHQPEPPEPALLINIIAPATGATEYYLQAWLWNGEPYPPKVYETTRPASMTTLTTDETFCRVVLTELSSKQSLEFLVPRDLMDYAFDQWPIQQPGRLKRLFSHRYKMVIRPRDRVDFWLDEAHTVHEDWPNRWQLLPQAEYDQAVICLTEPATFDPEELVEAITEETVAVWLTFQPPYRAPDDDQFDFLDVLIETGVPVALWSRYPDEIAPEMTQCFKKLTQELDCLTNLPAKIRQYRRQAKAKNPTDPGHKLTLMWDDPTRIPPDLPAMQMPAQRT